MSPKAIQSLIELFGVEKGLHILNIFTAMDDAGMHQQYRQFRMKREHTPPDEIAENTEPTPRNRPASDQNTPGQPDNRTHASGQTVHKPSSTGKAQQAVPLVTGAPTSRT